MYSLIVASRTADNAVKMEVTVEDKVLPRAQRKADMEGRRLRRQGKRTLTFDLRNMDMVVGEQGDSINFVLRNGRGTFLVENSVIVA